MKAPSLSDEHLLFTTTKTTTSTVNSDDISTMRLTTPPAAAAAAATVDTQQPNLLHTPTGVADPVAGVDHPSGVSCGAANEALIGFDDNDNGSIMSGGGGGGGGVRSDSMHSHINRFNSDKSIYYSSELLSEKAAGASSSIGSEQPSTATTTTNVPIHVNTDLDSQNSNNNSTNNSSLTSPDIQRSILPAGATTTAAPPPPPPPLPPPPVCTPHPQQPPPLPPLPPSLASKYYVAKSSSVVAAAAAALLDQQQQHGQLQQLHHANGNSLDSGDDSGQAHFRILGDEILMPVESLGLVAAHSPQQQQQQQQRSTTRPPHAATTVSSSDERSASFIDTKYLPAASTTNAAAATSIHVDTTTTTTTPLMAPPAHPPPLAITPTQPQAQQPSPATSTQSQCTTVLAVAVAKPTSVENSHRHQHQQQPPEFRDTVLTLLKRLLGCLGNVNAIKDPLVHKRIFDYIHGKWDRLSKINDELRLVDLARLVVRPAHFAPWLFEAIYELPFAFQQGKLIAYKTLCRMAIRGSSSSSSFSHLNQHHQSAYDSLSDSFMDMFLVCLHQALVSSASSADQRTLVNCIVQACGTRFWHCMMPSSTLLLVAFVRACASVEERDVCKLDAALMLGALAPFPDYFGESMTMLEVNRHF